MLRDIFNALTFSVNQVQPPGSTGPTAAATNTGTGSVAFDASSQSFGTFKGLLQVLTPGAPGAATAKLSLDGGNNYDAAFTIPAGSPGLAVPLPAISPGVGSPDLSGLVLNFSGNFSAGDSFNFLVLPTVTFLFGAEEAAAQDTLFPRVVLVPTRDEFSGTEDYAQGHDVRNAPRSLVTDVGHFELHCWGLDYDRTELLRDTVINGLHFAVWATKRFMAGHWDNDKELSKAGRLYVLEATVLKPVPKLPVDFTPVPPTFTANLSQEVDHQ